MNLPKECCAVEAHTIIVRRENGKSFRIENLSRVSVTVCSVDGCALSGHEKKCDYLFMVGEKLLALVELKGTDHVKAVRQIIDSAEALNVKVFPGKRRSYIVSAACPKANTRFQSERKKQARRFKAQGLSVPEKKNGNFSLKV